MKRILLVAALVLSTAVPAQADTWRHHNAGVMLAPPMASHHNHHGGYRNTGGEWVVPLIGGVILGGIINQSQQPRPPVIVQQAPPVIIQQAPVYTQPPVIVYQGDFGPPQGDPYALQRQCRLEPVYNAQGQFLGQQTICN